MDGFLARWQTNQLYLDNPSLLSRKGKVIFKAIPSILQSCNPYIEVAWKLLLAESAQVWHIQPWWPCTATLGVPSTWTDVIGSPLESCNAADIITITTIYWAIHSVLGIPNTTFPKSSQQNYEIIWWGIFSRGRNWDSESSRSVVRVGFEPKSSWFHSPFSFHHTPPPFHGNSSKPGECRLR